MHVFERAGLGLAPFRVIGFSQETYQAHPDAPVQPGAACAYCGTAIVQVCRVKSADGRVFKVGCNCVDKTGDRGIIQAYKKSPAYRKMQRDARHRLAAQKVAAAWALLEDPTVREKLSALPHPYSWVKVEGDGPATLLDHVIWNLERAGDSGSSAMLGLITRTIKEHE